MPGASWSPADKARAIQLAADGVGIDEIARRIGRTPRAVDEQLRRIASPARNQGMSQDDRVSGKAATLAAKEDPTMGGGTLSNRAPAASIGPRPVYTNFEIALLHTLERIARALEQCGQRGDVIRELSKDEGRAIEVGEQIAAAAREAKRRAEVRALRRVAAGKRLGDLKALNLPREAILTAMSLEFPDLSDEGWPKEDPSPAALYPGEKVDRQGTVEWKGDEVDLPGYVPTGQHVGNAQQQMPTARPPTEEELRAAALARMAEWTEPEPAPPERPEEEKWGQRLAMWRQMKMWLAEWGAMPGQAGCEVPREMLRREEGGY